MGTQYNIKEIRQLYNLTQEEFALSLGITREMINKMEKGKCRVSKATQMLIRQFIQDRQSDKFSHHSFENDVVLLGAANSKTASLPYLTQRREHKKANVPFTVPLVGIKAQAGYIKGYEQVDYLETLDQYSLPPGVNPTGAEWRYFEVDGDSMEPTLHAGDIILASMLPAEDWKEIKDLNVYLILTNEQLLVKRVVQKNESEWILISDNDEAYPQITIGVANVIQVWTFRRHIRSRVPQPKEFIVSS